MKQDAAESRQQIKTLTDTNTALSSRIYQLEASQAASHSHPTPALAAEEKVDLTAFLLQATGEGGGGSPQLDVEQFDSSYGGNYEAAGDAPSPVLQVDEDF